MCNLDGEGTYPVSADWWEEELKEYGPIIVGGCIGAVEFLGGTGAGHFVLVIGIDNADNIGLSGSSRGSS